MAQPLPTQVDPSFSRANKASKASVWEIPTDDSNTKPASSYKRLRLTTLRLRRMVSKVNKGAIKFMT